jgi:hypothetical protein
MPSLQLQSSEPQYDLVFRQSGSPPCSPSVVIGWSDDGKAHYGECMLRQRRDLFVPYHGWKQVRLHGRVGFL